MVQNLSYSDISASDWSASMPVFDSSQLGLSVGNDQVFMQDMVMSGIHALSEQIAELARPGDQWPRMTHRLKGLAASIGAKRMAQIAKHAETVTDVQDQAAWHAKLSEELLTLVVAVSKICPSICAARP